MKRAARPLDGDVALLQSTARRLGLQTALLVATAVIVLASVASFVVLAHQHSAAESALSSAAAHADDVNDPPYGMWLVLRGASRQQVSPGLPAGLPYVPSFDKATRTGQPDEVDVTVRGRDYRVRTQVRGTGAVQAVLDLGASHDERNLLLLALLTLGFGSLVAGALVGALLARKAVRPLSEALTLQRTFVADASHELRTPLTLLSTRTQILRRRLAQAGVDPALLVNADGVVADAQRLSAIVEDLLLSADPRADTPRERMELDALCKDVAASARAYARAREVSIVVDEQPSAGPVVLASPAAIRRAVMALLDNAIEHTPPGGTVMLTTGFEGRQATLTLADTGGGMDEEMARRAFQRFHSGRQRSGRRSYGLGLALARDIVVRHGGTIRTNPAPSGTGTQFTLSLRHCP